MLPPRQNSRDELPRTAWPFPHKALLVAFIGILILLAWTLSDVLMLIFGSVVLAVALRSLARLLENRLRVPGRISVALSVLGVVVVLAVIGWLVGDALAAQFSDLNQRLPQAWQDASAWLSRYEVGRQLLGLMGDMRETGLTVASLATAVNVTLGAVGGALLMVIVSVCLAADPATYRAGLIRLLVPAYRRRGEDALDASAEGLARWLLGQGLSMLFLGTTTFLGLWAIGAPLPMALGIITGLFSFVPFFGAVAAGLLSVLMAFSNGPETALYVALLFLAVQQLEEYLVMPMVQRWAVSLPPALTLIAAVVFGILFGPLGVVFATPMMVVVVVLVRRVLVEGVLEQRPLEHLDPAQDEVNGGA
jgi:predicted PurR-regulated permease PerM